MKAMILCAGFGTRLGGLTKNTPKVLLPVGKYPILAYIIANLSHCGIKDVAINLHFMPDLIRGYLGDGRKFGVKITYSYEPELLGTAGGVKKLEAFFRGNDAFLVHYGDVLTDQNLLLMIYEHFRRKALVTLLVHQRKNSNSIIQLDSKNRITSFFERPSVLKCEKQTLKDNWVNSGIYICHPDILNEIPENTVCDFPRDIFTKLSGSGKLFGFPLSGYRCAIDSQQRLTEVSHALSNGEFIPVLNQQDHTYS
jgi:mannose-1-phosphate guanylyltransferase